MGDSVSQLLLIGLADTVRLLGCYCGKSAGLQETCNEHIDILIQVELGEYSHSSGILVPTASCTSAAAIRFASMYSWMASWWSLK